MIEESSFITASSANYTHIIFTQNPLCNLIINTNLVIQFYAKKPNWWWRMWQFLIFGFKWVDYQSKKI